MIRKWFKVEARSGSYLKFKVIDLSEKNSPHELEDLKKYLATQLLTHLVDPQWLKNKYENMSDDKFKKYLINHVLPASDAQFSLRSSTWGEIVAAEILEKIKETIIPIYKLRYKELRNQAMRGKADVLTCKILKSAPIIFFSEVKTYTTYSKDVAKKAYEGLLANNVEIPEIINFISRILYKDDEYFLADIFDKAIIDPNSYKKSFHIFLIIEKKIWDDEILDILHSQDIELPNLTVNIVLINSLKDLIEENYSLLLEIAGDVCLDA